MAKPTFNRLLDAGVTFTATSRKQAEAIVKQLVKAGEVQRKDAEAAVQSLVDRGRETTERLSALVQGEVAKQVGRLSEQFDSSRTVSRRSPSG